MGGPIGVVIETAETMPWGAVWRTRLPAAAAGSWVALHVPGPASAFMKLALFDTARGHVVRQVFLRRRLAGGAARFETLLHVPAEAGAMDLLVFGPAAPPRAASLRVLGRGAAAMRLLGWGWRCLPDALRGDPLGLAGRARALLGQAPSRAGTVPPYAAWIALFESRVPPPAAAPRFPVVLLGEGDDAATRAALPPGLDLRRVRRAADWAELPPGPALLIGAGEVPHPHALAWFAGAAQGFAPETVVVGDCDVLGPAGRQAPLFKPGADPRFARSGLFAAGAMLADPAGLAVAPGAARQALALRPGAALRHIPRVLTHLPAPPRALPPAAAIGAAPAGRVSAIVPTALRSAHAVHCLRRVLRSVPPGALALRLSLSAPERARPALLRRARALPGAEIVACPMPAFNFSAAINAAAAGAETEFLLLLNDDVAPRDTAWLPAMLAEMADPAVGIVGARLRYGNGMVQHEGVALGLGGLVEHLGRHRLAGDDGPHGIGAITRRVAAVTAACMLVRTSLFRQLGGFDPAFAIALNDVDFCLRARAAGAEVVYCATAELTHYESLSLGRHYAGARAALEAVEVRALRARWGARLAADPFGNPQASQEMGRAFEPAFPPAGPGFAVPDSDLG